MRRIVGTGLVIVTAVVVVLSGCGEKLPLPSNIVDEPDGRLVDTVYLAVRPPWTEADGVPFARPGGIHVGYDRTLYISDTDNNRIVRLDLEGNLIETFAIPHPRAVAQDRAFNLAAVTQSDTIWLHRFRDQGEFVPHLVPDSVKRCEPLPRGGQVCAWYQSSFLDIAASPELDGWFFVIDETYNRVNRFNLNFPFLENGVDSGSGLGKVALPLSIETGPSPEGYRIYVTQFAGQLGLQYLLGRVRGAVPLDENADIFTMVPQGYKLVTADAKGNVYVLVAATSEVLKFDRRGEFVLRFGREGSDLLSLNDPLDIAVLDETVYIADTGNNRIIRYRLAAVPEG